MAVRAAAGEAAVRTAFPVAVAPKLVSAASSVEAPVPPATMGRTVLASVSRSATRVLWFDEEIVVPVVTTAPGGTV
jgi:hypothetical protein